MAAAENKKAGGSHGLVRVIVLDALERISEISATTEVKVCQKYLTKLDRRELVSNIILQTMGVSRIAVTPIQFNSIQSMPSSTVRQLPRLRRRRREGF